MNPHHPTAPLATAPQPGDHERWLELLGRLEVEPLARRFIALVRQIDGYREPPIPISRILADAVESFERLIDALATDDTAPTLQIAIRVGTTRARAEVPLISLMAAIQLDFSMLWESLCAVAEEHDAPLLLRHTSRVWQVVDDYVRQTEQAYLAEERRMAEEVDSVRRGLTAELLGGAEPSPTRLAQLAERLGVELGDEYAVAFAAGGAVASLRIAIARLAGSGRTTLETYHHGGLVLAVPLRPGDPTGAVEGLATLPIGLVGSVPGLAGLARATRLAVELASLADHDRAEAITPERGWTRLLRRRLANAPMRGVFEIEGALDGCGPAERRHLLEAVRSYLRTGSAQASAAELYCHRNTLTNRLRRFAELTGIDVAVPEQAARAVIALG